MRFALICVCFLLGASAQSAAAQTATPDDAEANPARPTVSTPATLTPVGYLQFETGALAANRSPEFSSSYGWNEVIKLSVARRLELIAAAGPIAPSTAGGNTANAVGDVFLGAQGVLLRGEGSR